MGFKDAFKKKKPADEPKPDDDLGATDKDEEMTEQDIAAMRDSLLKDPDVLLYYQLKAGEAKAKLLEKMS